MFGHRKSPGLTMSPYWSLLFEIVIKKKFVRSVPGDLIRYEPPLSIPNREVKVSNSNGTNLRGWESRICQEPSA